MPAADDSLQECLDAVGTRIKPHVVVLSAGGLVLAALGLQQIAIAGESRPHIQFGWALIIAGWVLLLSVLLVRRTIWPELVIFLILLAAFRIPGPQTHDERVRIPLPATKFEGGVEFLSPGQVVGLNVMAPNASKTPVVQVSTHGEVVEVRGKEASAVLIEFEPANAEAFQQALLADGAKITLRLLEATPAATSTPETTPTPVPVRGYLEIEAARIRPRPSALSATKTDDGKAPEARLVIVEKREEAPAGKPESVTTTYAAQYFCVRVEAFLDGSGSEHAAYDSNNIISVRVSFPIAKLDAIVASLASAVPGQIWIENQTGCQ